MSAAGVWCHTGPVLTARPEFLGPAVHLLVAGCRPAYNGGPEHARAYLERARDSELRDETRRYRDLVVGMKPVYCGTRRNRCRAMMATFSRVSEVHCSVGGRARPPPP